MSNYSKLYWLTRLDSIKGFFTICTVLCMIALVVAVIIYLVTSGDMYVEDDKKRVANCKKVIKWSVVLSFLFWVPSILIPDTKEGMIIIAGGKTMDYVQKDTSLSKLPYQTTAIISKFLTNEMDSLKHKK